MRALLVAATLVIASCSSKAAHEPTTVACEAPRLVASRLPDGMRSVQAPAKVPSDWSMSWRDAHRFLQVAGGVRADLGDDASLRRTRIRGEPATYGRMGDDATMVVDWTEPTRCGPQKYTVLVRGLSVDEMLRVARSLRRR